MLQFTMLVGVSGSGKSTLARSLAGSTDITLLSSDELRGELLGDESDQSDPAMIFAEMKKRAVAALNKGLSVIYDATNLSSRRRRATLNDIKHSLKDKVASVKFKCVVVVAPERECVGRQSKRDRKVSAEVIHRQILSFEVPYYGEGWDVIELRHTSLDYPYCEDDSFDAIFPLAMEMDQHNSHHSLTIGQHCAQTLWEVHHRMGDSFTPEYRTMVREAAMWHDLGKCFTQTFTDMRSNPSDEAHYYNHHNYSAYLYLCAFYAPFRDPQCLWVALLIQWHMQPFFTDDIDGWARKRNIAGEVIGGNVPDSTYFLNAIQLLHEADLAAR